MVSWDSITEREYIKEGITCELDHLKPDIIKKVDATSNLS
jgi:hypothetical protein